jgi:hypothetical protein
VTPEHAHLLLVHLPIVGLMAAFVPLAFGALRRDRTAVGLGLALVALFGAATPFVAYTGEEAEERFEHGPLSLDAPSEHWLEEHEERAEKAAIVLYVIAGAAALGLGVLVKKQELPARPVGAAALVVTGLGLGALVWAADAGGKIRHPELRPTGSTAGAVTPR